MKQTAFASFIAFWASALTLLAVSVLMPDNSQAQNETAAYTLAEINQHNQLDDCWMAIEGIVYDFTDYVPLHPTPPRVLQNWCGTEATEGMRTKGYGNDHSEMAWGMMESYRIGVLAE